MENFIALGKKIYNMENPREVRRMWVFVARCVLRRGSMNQLDQFFHTTPELAHLADIYPFVYEQPTRAFFYNQSTFLERLELIRYHFLFMTGHFPMETLESIYNGTGKNLWQMQSDDGEPLRLQLCFNGGQRKEGLLSTMLFEGDKILYQIIFWINQDKNGMPALWIGAMQGPNMDNAKEVIKKITKRCHGYRTKNLILYMTQVVARTLGIHHIYAVTNFGYYANNHVRLDRKLKTSFSDFWREIGGSETEDKRFDVLPLTESRKTLDIVPTRKRAVYRRRFQLLDEIEATVEENMKSLIIS